VTKKCFAALSAGTAREDACSCLQRYKTEPVYRRKNEPPLAGCFFFVLEILIV
jgi:hypothetical protein